MSKITALPERLAFTGDEQVVMAVAGIGTRRGRIGGLVAQVAEPHVTLAQQAAAQAIAAAATAAFNRKVYATVGAGLADTNEGDYFFTPGATPEEFLLLWSHDAGGVATLYGSMPSSDLLAALQASAADADAAADTARERAEEAIAAGGQATMQAGIAAAAAATATEAANAADEARLKLQANVHSFDVSDEEQALFILEVAPVVTPILYVNGVRQRPARLTWDGVNCTIDPPLRLDDEVDFVVIEPSMQPAVEKAHVIGLADELDARPTVTQLAQPGAAATIGTANGATVQQELARAFTILERRRILSLEEVATSTELDDLYTGDPETNLAPLLQRLGDAADALHCNAHIPGWKLRLENSVTWRPRVSFTSDPDAELVWTNPASCSFIIDGAGIATPGHCVGDVPRMIGPHDISGYYEVGKDYSVVDFSAVGFVAKDIIWATFSLQYAIGWGRPVVQTNSYVPTDNLDFDVGTIDICKHGLSIISPDGAATAVGQSRWKTRNIFALRPVYFEAPTGSPGIFEVDIDSLGLHVAEEGGACIWHQGDKISDCRIKAKVRNGYAFNDSPHATPVDMRGVLVGGDGLAGADTGWAVGTRNHYSLHLDEFEPQAGGPVAVKMRGPGSQVEITSPLAVTSNTYASVALSDVQGEANYNDGVGGAALHPITRVNVEVVALAPGATKTFYMYHCGLNADNILPLQILQTDNLTDLDIYTRNNGPAVPREIQVIVRNASAAPVSQTINLWIKVPQ